MSEISEVDHTDDIREVNALRGILPDRLLSNIAARAFYLLNRHRLPGTEMITLEDMFGPDAAAEIETAVLGDDN